MTSHCALIALVLVQDYGRAYYNVLIAPLVIARFREEIKQEKVLWYHEISQRVGITVRRYMGTTVQGITKLGQLPSNRGTYQ